MPLWKLLRNDGQVAIRVAEARVVQDFVPLVHPTLDHQPLLRVPENVLEQLAAVVARASGASPLVAHREQQQRVRAGSVRARRVPHTVGGSA